MKAIMVMFDSLNRRYLPPYGNDWVHAPNFARLAEKTVTFDNNYAGSLPCMPARRELHTGRYNFLHRGWSPIEPFDDSMPELLKKAGIATHLSTDHDHYWEDGGATYHTRYSTWEGARAKGVPERAVITKHALKNALIPIITVAGNQFGHLVGGTMIIETIFSIPGMGTLIVQGVNQRDYPVVQAGAIFLAIAFSLIMLVVDLLYAAADPRIKAKYANQGKKVKKHA